MLSMTSRLLTSHTAYVIGLCHQRRETGFIARPRGCTESLPAVKRRGRDVVTEMLVSLLLLLRVDAVGLR